MGEPVHRSRRRCARALLAAFVLALACATPSDERIEPPDVSVVNLVPLEASPFEQRLRVVLRLTNRNNVPLELEGLRFDLELNGQPFTRGVSNEEVTLPRLGDATLDVTATTTLLDLLRQVKTLTESPQLGFPYRIEGRVFLAGPNAGGVDFERSGELGIAGETPTDR